MNESTPGILEIIESQPRPVCAKLTPFTVSHAIADTGDIRLRFEPQPAFSNHFNNVQGGFAVAMLDCVLSLAAFCKTGKWLPTVEISTRFLEPLPIGVCIGEGRVLKTGRKLTFTTAHLLSPSGAIAIAATATAINPD